MFDLVLWDWPQYSEFVCKTEPNLCDANCPAQHQQEWGLYIVRKAL